MGLTEGSGCALIHPTNSLDHSPESGPQSVVPSLYAHLAFEDLPAGWALPLCLLRTRVPWAAGGSYAGLRWRVVRPVSFYPCPGNPVFPELGVSVVAPTFSPCLALQSPVCRCKCVEYHWPNALVGHGCVDKLKAALGPLGTERVDSPFLRLVLDECLPQTAVLVLGTVAP